MATSKIDKVHIPRKADGRYKLQEEDKPLVIEDLKILSRAEVAAKWNIGKTTIHWLLNPEKYIAHLKRKSTKSYYNKEKAREYKARNRAKKRKLLDKEGK